MTEIYRFLDTQTQDAALNMAIDEAVRYREPGCGVAHVPWLSPAPGFRSG